MQDPFMGQEWRRTHHCYLHLIVRTQSHGHIQLPERLRKVIYLFAYRGKKIFLINFKSVSALLIHHPRSSKTLPLSELLQTGGCLLNAYGTYLVFSFTHSINILVYYHSGMYVLFSIRIKKRS